MKKLIFAFFVMFAATAQSAQSLLVYNNTTGQMVYEQDIERIRPIASVTKLMTAMVALEYDKDLSRRLTLSKRVGGTIPRQTYTRYELLTAMLVRSDNAAAETLAGDYPGGRSAFIQAMNKRATDYRMINTHFDDPTGLSALNVSTAHEVAQMVEAASGYWVIRELSTRKDADFKTASKKKTRTLTLHNTNTAILREYKSVVVSKTGFTSRAGWCVAMFVEQNDNYTVVVLGSDSKQHRIKTADWLMYNHLDRKHDDVVFVSRSSL